MSPKEKMRKRSEGPQPRLPREAKSGRETEESSGASATSEKKGGKRLPSNLASADSRRLVISVRDSVSSGRGTREINRRGRAAKHVGRPLKRNVSSLAASRFPASPFDKTTHWRRTLGRICVIVDRFRRTHGGWTNRRGNRCAIIVAREPRNATLCVIMPWVNARNECSPSTMRIYPRTQNNIFLLLRKAITQCSFLV